MDEGTALEGAGKRGEWQEELSSLAADLDAVPGNQQEA